MVERAFEEQVVVQAPPEAVWPLLEDVERWPTWTASMREVTLLDPGPLAVGSRVRVRQPRLPATVWTVQELREGRSFAWGSSSPGMRTVGDHRVEPHPQGSLVTLTLRLTGPAAPVSALLFGSLVRRYVRMEGAGLTQRAEASTV